MKTVAILLLALAISCGPAKQYIYTEPCLPTIRTPAPPILAPIPKGGIDCLEGDVKVDFWMFYMRIGKYVKELHRAIELYNEWAIEKNIKNKYTEEKVKEIHNED